MHIIMCGLLNRRKVNRYTIYYAPKEIENKCNDKLRKTFSGQSVIFRVFYIDEVLK